MKAADRSGAPRRLTTSTNTKQYPRSLRPHGRYAVLLEQAADTGNDLSLLDLEGTPAAPANHRVEPLLRTLGGEINPAVSPDGRWLAYASNESGVKRGVRPSLPARRRRPLDSFVRRRQPPRLAAGRQRTLLQLRGRGHVRPHRREDHVHLRQSGEVVQLAGAATDGLGPTFDVSPDGKRFLMIERSTTAEVPATNGIVVVMNWGEELKAALR